MAAGIVIPGILLTLARPSGLKQTVVLSSPRVRITFTCSGLRTEISEVGMQQPEWQAVIERACVYSIMTVLRECLQTFARATLAFNTW